MGVQALPTGQGKGVGVSESVGGLVRARREGTRAGEMGRGGVVVKERYPDSPDGGY